jgi:hypothetical protein
MHIGLFFRNRVAALTGAGQVMKHYAGNVGGENSVHWRMVNIMGRSAEPRLFCFMFRWFADNFEVARIEIVRLMDG